MSDHMVTLPTPLTDRACFGMGAVPDIYVRAEFARELERDCMTLALRLSSLDSNAFAPETREVMERWRPRVDALLANPK